MNQIIEESMKSNEFEIFIFVMIALLINLIVGIFSYNKSKSTIEYTSEPNKFGSLITILSLLGTIVGGGMFLAVSQIGYEAGIVGYIIGLIYIAGFFILSKYVPKIKVILDKNKNKTLLSILENNFSTKTSKLFALTNLIMYAFLLAAQFLALYTVGNFLINYIDSLYIIIISIFAVLTVYIYPIIGGLKKDIMTDVIQMIFISIATIIITFVLLNSIDFHDFSTNLTPLHFTGTGYGNIFLIGILIFLTPIFIVRYDIWQRIGSAKQVDEKSLSRNFIIVGVISAIFYFVKRENDRSGN